MVINTAIKPSRDEMLGIMDAIREMRPGARPRFFHATPATKPSNIAAFASDGVDGLIFCGVRAKTMIDFVKLMPNHPPIVLSVYRPLTKEERELLGYGGTVLLDNEAIGRQAAEFFFDHGIHNFAYFGSNVQRERIAGKIRCESFRRHLKKQFGNQMNFSEFTEGICCGSNDDFWEGGLKPVDDWIKSLPQPCGIFVNGDREAFGLIDMCTHQGIAVPGTFEILSINNSYGFCKRSRPTISSISPDHDKCAREAVKMMLALIDNPDLPMEQRDVKVDAATLMERGTTLSGRKHGLVVTRAREYIQLNACNGIKVTDVAKNIGVAVRTLEMRVIEATGRNVHSMIRDIRLEKVCSLLKTTDLPISRVTTMSGYRKITSLASLFKKMFGMSMRQYRNKYRKSKQAPTVAESNMQCEPTAS